MKYTVITSSNSFNFNSMIEALNYIAYNKISNYKLVRK